MALWAWNQAAAARMMTLIGMIRSVGMVMILAAVSGFAIKRCCFLLFNLDAGLS